MYLKQEKHVGYMGLNLELAMGSCGFLATKPKANYF